MNNLWFFKLLFVAGVWLPMRVALKFAYDGRNYHGYARQPNLSTVEGDLIKVLIKYGIIEDTVSSVFRSSSRTDKGVSAFGNVLAFNTDFATSQILEELSLELEKIIPFALALVDDDFNPRFASFRHYRYFLKSDDFDKKSLIKTLSLFTGEHDFSNFCRLESYKAPVRNIENIVVSDFDSSFVAVDFFAQNFLWHQIRRIVSSVEKVSLGKIDNQDVVEALCNPDKNVDFGLAKPDFLFLMDVVYDFDFKCDDLLFKRAKDLEEKIISSFV